MISVVFYYLGFIIVTCIKMFYIFGTLKPILMGFSKMKILLCLIYYTRTQFGG